MQLPLAAVVAVLLFALIVCTDGQDVEEKRSDDQNKYSPMWFGPRVGRRKRGDAFGGSRGEIDALVEFVRKNPWTVLLIHSDKPRMFDYIPKIPKDSSEEMGDDNIVVQRSMFTPRLGRTPFIPRLGRDSEITLS